MDKKFLIKFAFRNLWAHRMRSVLTLTGITIGVGAIIFLVAFAFGLERLVTETVTGGNAFKLIDVGTGNSQIVKLDERSLEKMKQLTNVSDVEVIMNAGAKAVKNSNSMDLSFYGSSNKYMDWLGLKIKYGNSLPDDPKSKNIVVTTAYLKFLGNGSPENYLKQKETFNIIIPKELSDKDQSIEIPNQDLVISGIIEDDTDPAVYIDYQNLISAGANIFSQAKIEVNNMNQVPAIRAQLENMGFKTQYVGDTVSQIEQIFNVFKIILSSFGLIALVVASLGMFNTLTISLLERMKEIALMKILGMRKKDINHIFLTEAIIFGFFGGFLGILLGWILGKLANAILNHFAIAAGGNPVSIFYYPIWFIFAVIAFSVLVGFLTGLYPARRAMKLNALDVMRYE